jgi:hypothetical protein
VFFKQRSASYRWSFHTSFNRILTLLLMIVVLSATGWGTLAIYYGDSQTSVLQSVLASVFAAAGLLAATVVWLPRWRKSFLVIFGVLFLVVLTWWFNISPSNDRVWQTDVTQLPYAEIKGNEVTVHNVRNFRYRSETDYLPVYETRTYDLSKLESVDLFTVYWMGPAIAHTIISFGFADDDYLAVSIEARKEEGEGYSSIKGFFRQYELIYIVADERDLIGLRTNYRQNPPEQVYRYRLAVSPNVARGFFLEYLKSINEISKEPRFYNTLTANCTNVIWMHAQVNPDRVPFSWKILASGYAAEYLYDMQRLDNSVPFDTLTQQGHVNPLANSLGITDAFSKQIRQNHLTIKTIKSGKKVRVANDQ